MNMFNVGFINVITFGASRLKIYLILPFKLSYA